MKKCVIIALVVLSGLCLLSSSVLAATPTTPYFTYGGGSFTYDADTNALSISLSPGAITGVFHVDGSYAFNQYMGEPLWGGYFTLSTLYNGDGAGENWSFAPDSGSSPDFVLYDYYGNQRLTAEIYDFTVVQNGSLLEVNVNFDQNNVGSISTDPNSPASEFISDVDSFSLPWGNLYMKINMSGTNAKDFTEYQYGSVSGSFSVVPEPVSAILFITGGAAFAIRRKMRKRFEA